ncbi:MAG: SpoIIE family protein phosphatase [Bacilli bacterium]|nr:SpoIIE family protein phosphatase [Bacilli bacterium]
MFKKFNLVIVSFFSVLTVLLDIGFLLYIPVVFFYLLKDYKYIYYIIPSSLVSLLIFTGTSYLVSYGILVILLLFILWIMKYLSKGYYMYIIVGLLNFVTYIITFKGINDVGMFLGLSALSMLLYMYFEKNLFEALKINSYLYNQIVSEVFICLICILGSSNVYVFEVNMGFLVAAYFVMYASNSWKNIYTVILSMLVLVVQYVFFGQNEALFLPFIGVFYFLPFVYPVIILNAFSLIVIILNTGYNDITMVGLMIISLFFEVIRYFLGKEYETEEVIREGIYNQMAENFSNEMLSFAEVLDKFVENFKVSKTYNDKLTEAISILFQRHCNVCPKKKECFEKHKNVIYPYFKSLILQKDLYNKEMREFINGCYYSKNICSTAKNINYRIELNQDESSNNALIAQITGVSSSIKNYITEIVSKEELKYEEIKKLKQKLIMYGFDIKEFELKRAFKDDFLIELSLNDCNEKSLEGLKSIVSSFLNTPVSIIQDEEVIRIIPEIKVDIIYGSASVSGEGEHICGDNYMVKNFNNGKFVTAISDGMGKGYNAFCESNTTLKLINELAELSISSSTSLEILNTFYAVQEYLERYATLDLLEINRYTKMAKFYKMGATTTYIVKKSGKIEKVVNRNLPFGIDDSIENYNYFLEDDDLILMSSDGIFENILDDAALEKYILSIKEESPQKIVYELINYTMKQKLKVKDDMTLIALKIKMG